MIDLQWKCAGCGAPAIGMAKPCLCLTGVGYRWRGEVLEQVWFLAPGEPELKQKIDRVREMVDAGVNIAGAEPQANAVARAAFEACIEHIRDLEARAEAAESALAKSEAAREEDRAEARKVIKPFADVAGEYFARNYNRSDVIAGLPAVLDGRRVALTAGNVFAARTWLDKNGEAK